MKYALLLLLVIAGCDQDNQPSPEPQQVLEPPSPTPLPKEESSVVVKESPPEPTIKVVPKTRIDKLIHDATTRYVVFVMDADGCSNCRMFDRRVTRTNAFKNGLAARNCMVETVNESHESAFENFPTPSLVVWDKSIGKWHGAESQGDDTPLIALDRIDSCIKALNQ